MSAKQTITTTTTTVRKFKPRTQKPENTVKAAYVKGASAKRRVCPTCGRPL